MKIKDITIIEPDTGIVVNVVRDVSVERAAAFFPGFICIERKTGDLHEPGCKLKPDGQMEKRAVDVQEEEKKVAEDKIALLFEAAVSAVEVRGE